MTSVPHKLVPHEYERTIDEVALGLMRHAALFLTT